MRSVGLHAMPIDLSGRIIFLASPGGMATERAWVRDEVAVFNRLRFHGTNVMFIVTGFEDVPGTVNRPQAAINPLVEEADYMILLVGAQLGSSTTATPPFRTGIEEELSIALRSLEADDAPMLDIMLAFRAHAPSTLRRPSQGLRDVLEFKNAIEETKELLHVGAVGDEATLRHRVRVQLEAWAQPLRPKKPQSFPALMAALDGTNRPTMTQPPDDDADVLVQWAEEQATKGLNTVADSAFAQAIASNDPDHLHRYALFLQRTGQLKRAVTLDKQALDLLAGGNTVEHARLQADLLAHMAQLTRKLGDPRRAKRLLEEAVMTARPHARDISSTMGYVLDQLGIASARLGELDAAEAAYVEAHGLRRDTDDERGQAQSLINLARVARDRGNTPETVALLERAIAILDDGNETRVLANALSALGEAVAADAPDRARVLLARSLSINERLQNPDGMSVSSNGLARLALAVGDLNAAKMHAQQVLEVSNETGNQDGTAIASRLLGQIHLASGDPQAAAEAFRNALRVAARQRDPAREAQVRLGLARSLMDLKDQAGAVEHIKAGRVAAQNASDQRLLTQFDELAEDA